MARAPRKRFSQAVSVFHDRRLPEPAQPAGYAALIDAYDLKVPLPCTLSAIGSKHRTILKDGWRLLTPRHEPDATLEGHLVFALKHEGVDLAILKHLFLAVGAHEITALVRASPTGGYARRIWFLYEWLLGEPLDLPNATRGAYAPVVDPKLQWVARPVTSTRHRVKNNLPGTPEFLPAGVPNGRIGSLRCDEARGSRARDRRQGAEGHPIPNGRVSPPQGLQVELRDRGGGPSAGSRPALGACHRRGRPPAARYGGASSPAADRHRRRALRASGPQARRRFRRRARPRIPARRSRITSTPDPRTCLRSWAASSPSIAAPPRSSTRSLPLRSSPSASSTSIPSRTATDASTAT